MIGFPTRLYLHRKIIFHGRRKRKKKPKSIFLGSILSFSQIGDDGPQGKKDLARFGYQLNVKANLKKRRILLLATTYLNHV
jgi:hypothetical protein